MRGRRDADDGAIARGAQEIAFQLDGREVLRAGRQVGNAAVAACGVRKRDYGCRMQVSVGSQELIPDVELGADAILGNLGKTDADQAREAACSPVEKFVQRGFRAQRHDRSSRSNPELKTALRPSSCRWQPR